MFSISKKEYDKLEPSAQDILNYRLEQKDGYETFGEYKMTQYPWKHRSAGMTCSTCMWFAEKVTRVVGTEPNGTIVEGLLPPDTEVFGRCRRHAPTMQGYPAVFGNDWCGDHKLDEDKR
jgi:hypothetical protein